MSGEWDFELTSEAGDELWPELDFLPTGGTIISGLTDGENGRLRLKFRLKGTLASLAS